MTISVSTHRSLQDCPDVYFSTGYAACGLPVHQTWISLTTETGDWQIPLLLRELNNGYFDAVSPYGYTGVYCAQDVPSNRSASLWAESLDRLRELKIVSVFLRRSPWVAQAPLHDSERAIVKDHPVFSIDVTPSAEALWTAMEGRARTAVRKAQKSNMVTEIRPAQAADFAHDSDFISIYEAAMTQKAAASEYHFSLQYYLSLLDTLGGNLLLAQVKMGDEVVAATLLMRHHTMLHYHLSGAKREHMSLGSVSLLLWEIMQWASQQGLSTFNLGGGMGARDSLWRFKKSFGGKELLFQGTGLIVDQTQYNRMVQERCQQQNCEPQELQQSFFPLYRASKTQPPPPETT